MGTGPGGPPGRRRSLTDRDEPAGFQLVPHTADLALEAWAPSRAECITQAVSALVTSFVDIAELSAADSVSYEVEAGPDDDMLVQALEEVIYLLDVRGAVPVDLLVTDRDDNGLRVEATLAPVSDDDVTGAIPKAISRHQLEISRGERGWRCHVVIDV